MHVIDNRKKIDMPQPIQCERCGELATVHSNQYVYQPRIAYGQDIERVLTSVVSVIECPKCGVRTQTTNVAESDGH